MKKTVFISSTYEDLVAHRRAVWNLLEEFDTRVIGMEKFGARKESPLETCLSEVEISDIYIGIIAFRLGSIDQNSRKSYTRLEYERASELKKNILIYLIDEKNALMKAEFFDRGRKLEKLEAFKDILTDERTTEKFISEEDLVKKLRRDLKKHIDYKKQKEEVSEDEFERSARIIERLMLAPLSFSGNELRLQIHVDGKPYAASKDICEAYNFRFGATIGLPIKIIKPKGFEDIGLNELYISLKQYDDLPPFIKEKNIEVYAKPQFTDKNIDFTYAHFKSENYQYIVTAPEIMPGIKSGYIHADGKIVLILSKILEKEKRTRKSKNIE